MSGVIGNQAMRTKFVQKIHFVIGGWSHKSFTHYFLHF